MARRRRRSLRRCCLPSRRWEIVYAASLPNARVSQPVAQLALARINATEAQNSPQRLLCCCARLALPSVLVSYRSLACIRPKNPYSRRRHARASLRRRTFAGASRRETWTVTQQGALRRDKCGASCRARPTQQRHATNVAQGRTALQQPPSPPKWLPPGLNQHHQDGPRRRPHVRSRRRVRRRW